MQAEKVLGTCEKEARKTYITEEIVELINENRKRADTGSG